MLRSKSCKKIHSGKKPSFSSYDQQMNNYKNKNVLTILQNKQSFFKQVGVVFGAKFIGFEKSIKRLIKTDLSVTKPVIIKYFSKYFSIFLFLSVTFTISLK